MRKNYELAQENLRDMHKKKVSSLEGSLQQLRLQQEDAEVQLQQKSLQSQELQSRVASLEIDKAQLQQY